MDPHSETILSWALHAIAAYLGTLAVLDGPVLLIAYPLYLLLLYAAILIALAAGLSFGLRNHDPEPEIWLNPATEPR